MEKNWLKTIIFNKNFRDLRRIANNNIINNGTKITIRYEKQSTNIGQNTNRKFFQILSNSLNKFMAIHADDELVEQLICHSEKSNF